MKYRNNRRTRRRVYLVPVIAAVVVVALVVGVRHVYNQNLGPVSSSQQTKIVIIEKGSSVKEIARTLDERGVIRHAWVFEWYVHSMELGSKLKAGTYALSPSSNLKQVANTLSRGQVATSLVTIIPGRRIDQVRADLINDGYTVGAVDAALKPDQYRDLPVMTYIPAGTTSLEGFLYPDSYSKTAADDPSLVIRESLKAMGTQLTPDLQARFAARGLNVFQAVSLASVVEKEVDKQTDRDQVAQVFLSRRAKDMSLGSDVTAFYGAIAAGREPSVNYDSPYNTRLHKGLPVGPISTVSKGSLQSVANPAGTDWLYFVAGDDGITRFERTYEEHQADTNAYCRKLCGRE